MLVLVLAASAVWVAPSWQSDERTLVLRVRERQEILDILREGARDLGEEVVRRASEGEPPAVSAGPTVPPTEQLTRDDRHRLDRLVEEKLGED